MTNLDELERLRALAEQQLGTRELGSTYLYETDVDAYMTALRNSAEELIRDARRLQWIDKHAAFIDTLADSDNMIRIWYSPSEKSATGKTIREAIDAAIAEEGKG